MELTLAYTSISLLIAGTLAHYDAWDAPSKDFVGVLIAMLRTITRATLWPFIFWNKLYAKLRKLRRR